MGNNKTMRQQKSSKSNFKRSRKFNKKDEVTKEDFKKEGANDISWYASDLTLLRNVANFPWSTQSGLTYPTTVTSLNDVGPVILNRPYTEPGILAMHVLPGIGKTAADIDAVNVAANAIYTYVRHMNSGHSNYDAPDLMMYILAMDEVYSMINWCQRLYGTLTMYNIYNRYMPDALLRAQGVDPVWMRTNMVQFRYRLNMLIKQAATLVVPNSFPIFLRHAWLFRNYYIEGSDMKDQVYMYTPLNFREFNVPSGGGPGSLEYKAWNPNDPMGTPRYFHIDSTSHVITGDLILDKLERMVSTIYLSEDFGIMAGDIMKAYGVENVIKLSELPDAFTANLEPNNEVLLQFKNANLKYSALNMFNGKTAGGSDPDTDPFGNIYQDPNTNEIYEVTYVDYSHAVGADLYDNDSHIITLEGEPSPEMNMIMTRMHSHASHTVGTLGFDILCGTEFAVWMDIVTDVDTFSVVSMGSGQHINNFITYDNLVDQLRALAPFKYHPRFISLTIDPAASTTWTSSDVHIIGDHFQVDNFTILTNDMLDRLDQVAIMSELNVPHVALIS